MNTPAFRPSRHAQRGVVALMFGLTLVVLIGFAGLVLDLGRFFVIKSELQNAMDACALAAASQLRPWQGDPQAMTKARAYGKVVAGQNRANFQGGPVAIRDDQITFSDKIDFSSDADYNTASYVKCSFPLNGLPVYFMQVLNPQRSSQTVSAFAVAAARAAPSACVLPVGVCIAAGGSSSNHYGLTPGQWVATVTGSPYDPGNFGWIDFTPPAGGASELANMLVRGMNDDGTMCDGVSGPQIGDEVGKQGKKASLAAAWNSRFGWYKTGGGGYDVVTAPPDFTGYAFSADNNWPAAFNAYAGTPTVAGAVNYKTAAAQHLAYQGDVPKNISGNNYTASTVAQHQSYGLRRRLMKTPLVDCGVWNANGNAQSPILDFACVLMLNPIDLSGNPKGDVWNVAKLEFIGLTTDAGSPCSFAYSSVLVQ